MQAKLSYRHRVIADADLVLIRQLIAENPQCSRRRLSEKLCEAWNWVQPNGALRDMVCRGMMLMLHRQGLIELPPVRQVSRNSFGSRRRDKPEAVSVEQTHLSMSLAELGPLEIRQVRRTPEEALFNGLLQQHHYLGYSQPVGEHLKYLVFARGRPIACVAWSSAPRHLGSRDRFIGWCAQARLNNIRLLAYNTRFLILPWVRVAASGVAHPGSHGAEAVGRLAAAVRAPDLLRGDLHRSAALCRHLLPGGQLDGNGADHGSRQGCAHAGREPLDQAGAGLCPGQGLPPAAVAAGLDAAALAASPHEAARDRQRHPGRARPTPGQGPSRPSPPSNTFCSSGCSAPSCTSCCRCRTRRPRSSASSACCSATAPSTSATCSSAPRRRASRTRRPRRPRSAAESVPELVGNGAAAQASPGHGRNAAHAYSGAAIVQCDHPELESGDRCPAVRQGPCLRLAAPVHRQGGGPGAAGGHGVQAAAASLPAVRHHLHRCLARGGGLTARSTTPAARA